MVLQRLLPGHHLGKELQDLVKPSAGTIATLTPLVVLTVGSAAISAAILLVMELSKPLDGMIRVSSAPMRNALQHLSDPSP